MIRTRTRTRYLTAAVVAAARQMAAQGKIVDWIREELARTTGRVYSHTTLNDAIRGKTWATLTDPPPITHGERDPFTAAGFWSKAIPDPPPANGSACWTWHGVIQKSQPVFRLRRKYVSAIRLAWLLAPHAPGGHAAKGSLPERVRRNCRNNLCVNPAHLF